jgi:hypothetical protein
MLLTVCNHVSFAETCFCCLQEGNLRPAPPLKMPPFDPLSIDWSEKSILDLYLEYCVPEIKVDLMRILSVVSQNRLAKGRIAATIIQEK